MIGFKTAVPISTAAALILIDASYIFAFLQTGILASATALELLVFGVQIIKTVVIFLVKGLRNSEPATLVNIYGAELFILPFLAAAYFFVGAAPIGTVLNQFILGWMVGVAFVGLPYAAYRIGRGMLYSGSLATLLPSTIVVSELGVSLSNAASQAATAKIGLAQVADFAFFGEGKVSSESPEIFVALATVYVSSIIYATMGLDSKHDIDGRIALSLAAIGTGASLAWIFSLSFLTLSIVLVYLPPVLAIATVSWWFGRAR